MTAPSRPRIQPLPPGDPPEEVRAALEGWMRPGDDRIAPPLDTMARHPKLTRAYLKFSGHLLFTSSLPARERELLILRTASVTDSAFEREQHEVIARKEGITDAEIARVADGPDADGWSAGDAALLRAVDELLSTWTVSDATWDDLAATLDEHQLMDLVFTVGNYALFAMALHAFGVEPASDGPRLAERWGSDDG